MPTIPTIPPGPSTTPAPPTFSIITCTWNSAATLPDTLASVAAQTCRDIEHIFVDGGSHDATLALIAAYPGVKQVLHDVRGGISHAMNRGIEAARGQIVAHLHADDYYAHPDVLALVAAAFGRAAAEGRTLDWAYGAIEVLKEGRLTVPRPLPPFSYRAFASGRASIAHPAVFVRRAALQGAGMFDETLRYAMDIDLWMRLGAQSVPAVLDQPLAVFRDHAGSVSSSNRFAARREEWRVRRRYARQAPLAFGIYCLRYLKRLPALRAGALQAGAQRKVS